jgi:hypothetical protein
MHESLNITAPSPDRRHTAHFGIGGEIRFGPLYFSLAVDSRSFGQRSFGDAYLWSPASTLLAVQEWLTLDYAEGPITALLLIDIERGREAALARAVKGFAVPEAFDGPILRYHINYAGRGEVQHCELDTTTIKDWAVLA